MTSLSRIIHISLFLLLNSVVFGQNPKYYLNSSIEAQQINYSGGTNYTTSYSGGVQLFDRYYFDLGIGYRFRFRPSTHSEFDKLRWTTLKLSVNTGLLKNKRFTPGINMSFHKGLKVIDYEKSVDISEIRPYVYETGYPDYAPDPDFGFLIRKMNYEMQGNIYVRANFKFLTASIYGGVVSRKITLYSLHQKKDIHEYKTYFNVGVSLAVYFNKSD